jgi:hypothetical protein
MLCERFANPIIFAVFSADEDDETISGSVVGVEKVCDDFEETETAGKDDKEIFGAEEVVQVLLELLGFLSDLTRE